MQIDLTNKTDFIVSKTLFKKLESLFSYTLEILEIPNKACELLLVHNANIQVLNAEFRGINAPTDVLSFPLNTEFSSLLGSVVISIDIAKDMSASLSHSLEEEILLLFLHGILHLVGLDHETDNGEQRRLETRILTHFNLPSSLIVRI